MEWTVLTAVGLAGAYAGYVIGLLVHGALVERGGGGGGTDEPDPRPEGPSGKSSDFALWELEVSGSVVPGA